MTKSIVISGPPAVGKTTVAKGLAIEFKMNYVSGGDVLKEIAQEQGYNTAGDDWWDTADGMKFLAQRDENSEFDIRLDKKLIPLFENGCMVITSYTLPWLVDGGIKIWLDGSHDSSAKRMQSRDKIDSVSAYATTKKRFDKNKALYKKIYNFDFGYDKDIFDAVINTDNYSAAQVIEMAKKTINELQ